jgi:hypothetical protein
MSLWRGITRDQNQAAPVSRAFPAFPPSIDNALVNQ